MDSALPLPLLESMCARLARLTGSRPGQRGHYFRLADATGCSQLMRTLAIGLLTKHACCVFIRSRYTYGHDVLPEEWEPEEADQHGQGGAYPGERLGEPAALSAEAREATGAHDAVRVDAQDVVLTGTQVCRLHQLMDSDKTTKHVFS